MSGSIGLTVCPKCGGQAVEFSENWEEVISCPYCGYFKRIREVGCIMPGIDGEDEYDITDEMFSCARCGNSEEGHFPSKKRGINCEVVRDGDVFFRVHEEKGWGVLWVAYKGGVSHWGGVPQRINRKFVHKVIKLFQKPDVDRTSSYLTKWDSKKRKVVCVIGTTDIRNG